MAGATTRIRLGTSVLITAYYSPIMLAKQLATLDRVSHGRLDVGLGIGWSRDEYDAVGTPYERRGRRGDEFIRCLKTVWTDETVEFRGEFYRVPKSLVEPKPVQKPHPPITIGEMLKHELDLAQVYHRSEVEAFARVFYKPIEQQGPADHAHMQRHLQPAVDRFKALEDEDSRREFHEKLNAYVKVYSFLSQIIPYADPELEMLYSYGRFLFPHLPLGRDTSVVKVGDEVALQYYRLERVFAGVIGVREGEAQYIKSPTEVGTGRSTEEKAPLSEIISVLNERFGTQFTEEDRLFFQQIKEKACRDKQVIATALANPLDKFELGIRKLIEDLMIERMAENDEIVTRYMADREFQSSAFPILAREIFETVRAEASGTAS